MARMKLTRSNYYSDEANWQYMSASQFKAFEKCPAAAMAELRGEWRRPESTALAVGSYVDAYFSGELDQFKADHPEIFKRDGSPKAEFQAAHEAAQRLEQDELARMLLSGRHQVIKTGKIGGVWYKAAIDSLLTPRQVEAICERFPSVREIVPFGGPMIVDLKYMRDFEDIWSDEMQSKVPFPEYWGYDIQGAIYQKLDNRLAPFVIVAASKETVTDIDALHFPDEMLADCLAYVEANSPRYAAIKRGEIEPVGCGKCPYCKSIKKLSGIRHYNSIER